MRIAFPLAVCVLVLSGCGTAFTSGGGTSNFTAVVISGSGGQANDFFVTPGGSSGVSLSAQGQTSAGISASTKAGATFTWSASYLDATASYRSGASPNGSKKCPPVPKIVGSTAGAPPASGALFEDAGATVPVPPTFATATIYVAPVPTVIPPYCLLVTAMNANGSGLGSVTVVVSANP